MRQNVSNVLRAVGSSTVRSMRGKRLTDQPKQGGAMTGNSDRMRSDKEIGRQGRRQMDKAVPTIRKIVSLEPPVRSSKTGKWKTNRRGLFSWYHWDGSMWQTEELDFYKASPSTQVSRRTEPLLTAAQDGLNCRADDTVRKLGEFWVEYYNALQAVNRSMHAFNRLVADNTVIVHFLKTAPVKLCERFANDQAAIRALNYEMDIDIKNLRYIRLCMAPLLYSPLSFRSQVNRYYITKGGREKRFAGRTADRAYAAQWKQSFGSRWEGNSYIAFESRRMVSQQIRPEKLGGQDASDAFQAFFNIYAYSWAVEPMFTAIVVLYARLNRLADLTDHFRIWIIRHISFRKWNRIEVLIDQIREDTSELKELSSELAALRYHRMELFPGSVSKEELYLGKALWDQVHATNYPGKFGREKAIQRGYHRVKFDDTTKTRQPTRPHPKQATFEWLSKVLFQSSGEHIPIAKDALYGKP